MVFLGMSARDRASLRARLLCGVGLNCWAQATTHVLSNLPETSQYQPVAAVQHDCATWLCHEGDSRRSSGGRLRPRHTVNLIQQRLREAAGHTFEPPSPQHLDATLARREARSATERVPSGGSL